MELVGKGLLIEESNGNYRAVREQALIGLSRSHGVSRRHHLFVHEFSHALYFLDPNFRHQVSRAWDSLKPSERGFIMGAFMASGHYTSGEKWLMETETQAYAIGYPVGKAFLRILLKAERKCSRIEPSTSKECESYRSFEGNLVHLTEKLHDRYSRIAYCQVPLFSDFRIERDRVFPSDSFARCHPYEESWNRAFENSDKEPQPNDVDCLRLFNSAFDGILYDLNDFGLVNLEKRFCHRDKKTMEQ